MLIYLYVISFNYSVNLLQLKLDKMKLISEHADFFNVEHATKDEA